MAGDSKTEKATPKKRRDERKKGNVMMSKDVVAVATLIGTLVMLRVMEGVVWGITFMRMPIPTWPSSSAASTGRQSLMAITVQATNSSMTA